MSEVEEGIHSREKSEKNKERANWFQRVWREQVMVASESEAEANHLAREKMKSLSSREVAGIGTKQVLYGWALSVLHGIGSVLGAGLGIVGGGLIGGTVGAISTAEFGPGAVMGAAVGAFAGSVGGYQVGVEAAGWAYNRFIRKMDVTLPPLEKIDWFVGQVPGFNPPIIAGIRNMIDGFFGMRGNHDSSHKLAK